jgi:hypothetical protein
MTRLATVMTLLVLASAPAVNAQVPHKFFNHVDTPVSITYSASGEAQVVLDPPNATVSIAGYRKVSVRIGTAKATNFRINMGKISGTTLSQFFGGPITQTIRTFDVVGPEMVLWLRGGPPNTADTVQLWVYLTE